MILNENIRTFDSGFSQKGKASVAPHSVVELNQFSVIGEREKRV